MNTRSQRASELQTQLDALILKETKTHNENVSLKSQVAELESQSQILSNYRAVMDKIDELLPHLAKVDGGTIEGLVDYIKDTKNERKIWIDDHQMLTEEKYENEEKIEELEEQNQELWGDYYELEKEVKKLKEDKEKLEKKAVAWENISKRQNAEAVKLEKDKERKEFLERHNITAADFEQLVKESDDCDLPSCEEDEVKAEDCCCVVMNKAGVMLYEETRKENEELKKELKEVKKENENISVGWSQDRIREGEAISHINDIEKELKELKKESEEMYDILGTFTTNNPRGDYPTTQVKNLKKEQKVWKGELKEIREKWVNSRDYGEKLAKELKKQKTAALCARSAAEQSNADYEKLVDKNNNDNLNFSDILNEREGEIAKLTKDNKALKEWVDRNQTEINRLRDVIDHPNGVKEEIVDVKDDFEWTSYIGEDILYDGTIVFYIDLDKRWVIHQEIGGTYSVAVFDNGRSGSCGVSTHNNVWCDKETGKIAILEDSPEDDNPEESEEIYGTGRYVELSTLFDIVKDDVREGRSWRPSIFGQQTSSLNAVLQEEVDRLRCVVSLAKDKVAELEEAL